MVAQQTVETGKGGRMPMPEDGDIAPVVAHLDRVEELRPEDVEDGLWQELVTLLRQAVREDQQVDSLREEIADMGDEAVELLRQMAERVSRL